MKIARRRCRTCRFVHKRIDILECHRNPPQLSPHYDTVWVKVEADDFCGMWMTKKIAHIINGRRV